MFPDQQSTEAPETPVENTQWLVLDELVSHDLPESSPPGSPRPYLKSESNEPVAEAGQVPTAAELAERAAFREEAEEYELRRMHALLAEKEPVTDRPFAVERSARLHTHRYRRSCGVRRQSSSLLTRVSCSRSSTKTSATPTGSGSRFLATSTSRPRPFETGSRGKSGDSP